MAFLLHIETSTTMCSVALSFNDTLIGLKEVNTGYTHAENLHIFIRDILKSASIQPKELHAIAVSSGPGSYTGLRIGFSTAKGLAYALSIPLIVVDTLKALSVMAFNQHPADVLYCPMLDARRMEVYTALYTNSLQELMQPCAFLLSEESIGAFADQQKKVCFFGDGMPKARTLLETLPQASFAEAIAPSSTAMIGLAYQKFQRKEYSDTAYTKPFYLKDFFFNNGKK